ncbi:MAG: response regulator transcription factor [Endomicrobiia bacterium]
MKKKILVIDDEEEILSLVSDILEKEDFIVITATNTEEGFKKAVSSKPDLIITDITMPKIGGIELCRLLRNDERTKFIPVIMLTVLSSETDKIIGLEIGADDYITKPFSHKELIARVKALLRRVEIFKEKPQQVLKFEDLIVDLNSRVATINKKQIHLTPKEFDLLTLFLQKPNVVLTREFILETVFGYRVPVPTRTVDTHIKNLRKKLGSFGKKIKTVFGYGFKFVDEK